MSNIIIENIGWIVLVLIFIGYLSYVVYGFVTNSKNFKQFRESIKVGDEVADGRDNNSSSYVVTKVDGDKITIEKTVNIRWIYPVKKDEGKIFNSKLYRFEDK